MNTTIPTTAPTFRNNISPSQLDIVQRLTLASAGLTITVSCFALTGLFYKEIRRAFGPLLIMIMILTDCLAALGHYVDLLFGLCYVGAVMLQFFYLSSMLWTVCYTHYVFETFVRKSRVMMLTNWPYLLLYSVISFGIPALTCIIGLSVGIFGRTVPWCWIKFEFEAYRLGLFYVPYVLLFVIVIIFYLLVLRKVLSTNNSAVGKTKYHANFKVAQAVTIVFLLLRFPGLIDRLDEFFFQRENDVFALTVMHALFSPLRGFANSLIFLWITRRLYLVKFGCMKRPDTAYPSGNTLTRSLITQDIMEDSVLFEQPTQKGGAGSQYSSTPNGFALKKDRPTILPTQQDTPVILETGMLDDDRDSSKKYSLFIGTWNMGAAPPADLSEYLSPKGQAFDLYVFGMQECVYKPRHDYKSIEEDLLDTIRISLPGVYYTVCSQSMWQLRLVVLVKYDLKDLVHHVMIGKESTGLGNVIPNKGALGFTMWLENTSFCFLNTHLAAHECNVTRRNKDALQIINGLKWTRKNKERNKAHSIPLCIPKGFQLTQKFHHVFWFGDLNYRIDKLFEEVTEHISNEIKLRNGKTPDGEGLVALRKEDQLNKQRKLGKVFFGFKEGEVNFIPTYRYERNCREFSKKVVHGKIQSPSWCDRVLFKSLRSKELQLVAYDACHSVTSSDHSPVYAVFNVKAIPNLVPRQSVKQAYSLTVSEIKCSSLEAAKMMQDTMGRRTKLEPYVILHPTWMSKKDTIVTHVRKGDIEPTYLEDDIEQLNAFVGDMDVLPWHFLFIEVKDRSLHGQNDVLGEGFISIRKACTKLGQTVKFRTTLTRVGLCSGFVEGLITFKKVSSL